MANDQDDDKDYDIPFKRVKAEHPDAWAAWVGGFTHDDVFSIEDGTLWVHPGVPQDPWRWDPGTERWVQEEPEFSSEDG